MKNVAELALGIWVLLAASGCLVLSVHPAYDDESMGWDARLLGDWEDADDNASMAVERADWKSYRIRYVHPIEKGELTAYLTSVGDDRFLDMMPGRGEDHGSFLIPVHALVRVRLDGDRLELTPLSYDWFSDRLRGGMALAGLSVALDQKENALVTSPTGQLRAWLRRQPPAGPMFGAPTVFVRKRP